MPIESFDNVCVSRLIGRYEIDPKSKKFQGRETSIGVAMPVEKDSGADIQKLKNKFGGKRTPQVNKFVVTKEHRKDLKKLVKDMKASFEKDPKSLRGLDLSRIDFRGLQKLELKGLDLSGVNFSDCKFPDGTDFSGSELRKANFENAELIKAVFSDNDLSGARFVSAILKGAKFEDVILDKSYFGFAHLHMAEFIKIDLVKADFTNAFLYYTYFEDVDARGAIFKKAYFTYAKIIDSELHNTEFDEAKFFRCEISDTPLINSNLKNVVLDGICFLRVEFDKCVATGAKANFITRFEGCRGEPDVAWEGF